MKKRQLLCWLGVFGLLMLPGPAFGNGFALNENGAKAVAMGGAFAAQADDPSAIYFNPAGIVQLEGTQVSAGITPIIFKGSFESDGTSFVGQPGATTDLDERLFLIPHFYITHKFSDWLSFGLGEFSNFGLGTEWPDDWEGRYITGGTLAEITSFALNPVVTFRPFKRMSVSAGPVLQYLDIELQNNVLNPADPGNAAADFRSKLTADNWEWGWNAGLLVWLTENIKFGASYRSKVRHEFRDGKVELSGVSQAIGGDQSTRAKGNFDLPASAYLGLAWTHGPVTLEFDAQWTEWSVLDSLEVEFSPALLGGINQISEPRDWEDTWAYRFGIDYMLNEFFNLRAGFFYDESPIPDSTLDPLVPSGDRWNYSVGVGFHYASLTIDVGYDFLNDEDRTFNNLVGDYASKFGSPLLGQVTGRFKDVEAHVFSFTASYRF